MTPVDAGWTPRRRALSTGSASLATIRTRAALHGMQLYHVLIIIIKSFTRQLTRSLINSPTFHSFTLTPITRSFNHSYTQPLLDSTHSLYELITALFCSLLLLASSPSNPYHPSLPTSYPTPTPTPSSSVFVVVLVWVRYLSGAPQQWAITVYGVHRLHCNIVTSS